MEIIMEIIMAAMAKQEQQEEQQKQEAKEEEEEEGDKGRLPLPVELVDSISFLSFFFLSLFLFLFLWNGCHGDDHVGVEGTGLCQSQRKEKNFLPKKKTITPSYVTEMICFRQTGRTRRSGCHGNSYVPP